jgi:hypothetical protein
LQTRQVEENAFCIKFIPQSPRWSDSAVHELAPSHYSITSSASASRLSGIARPSALAAWRLITRSNLAARLAGRWVLCHSKSCPLDRSVEDFFKVYPVSSSRRAWSRRDRDGQTACRRCFGVSNLAEDAARNLNLAWHRLPAWPDAPSGLARLKRRFLLAPVSNGNISLMVDLARRNNFPWDAILGAEIAGDYKRKPRVYLKPLPRQRSTWLR